MAMSRDPKSKFQKKIIFPNSAFNIRKSYKISTRKTLYFRSYQPETSQGVENTLPPPPSAFRVKLDPAGRSVFQAASGTSLQANGTFHSTYQFGNNFYPQKTYVMDNLPHPVLLGQDFLSKYALSINFLTSHLTLGNSPNFIKGQHQNCFLNVIGFSHKKEASKIRFQS